MIKITLDRKLYYSLLILFVLLASAAESYSSSFCQPIPSATGSIINVSSAQAGQLKSIVGSASPGTTLLLEDGTYAVSGTLLFSSPNVTLRSLSGNRDSVIIDGEYNTNTLIQVMASNITIANVTLMRTNEHLIHFLGGGDHGNVYNVKFIDPTEHMIKINPSSGGAYNDFGTIACSEFILTNAGRPNIADNHGKGACYTGGIDAHTTAGWHIRDNVFKDIYCTESWRTGIAEHAIHFWQANRDEIVERNKIHNCARGIGFGLGGQNQNGTNNPYRTYPDNPLQGISGFVDNIGGVIKNNMIFSNVGSIVDTGIGFESALNAEVYHNTVYIPGTNWATIDTRYPTSNPIIKNNLVSSQMQVRSGALTPTYAGNIETASASMFVDAANGNLHLVNTASNVINAGVSLIGLVNNDIDEDVRDSNPAVGADETKDIIAPGPPTIIAVP